MPLSTKLTLYVLSSFSPSMNKLHLLIIGCGDKEVDCFLQRFSKPELHIWIILWVVLGSCFYPYTVYTRWMKDGWMFFEFSV